MGAYNSKLLVDFQPNSNSSFEYNLHKWEKTKPKNLEYYTGKRFFKISRSLYPQQFERGYLYGYSYLPQYHYTNYIDDDNSEDNEITRVF